MKLHSVYNSISKLFYQVSKSTVEISLMKNLVILTILFFTNSIFANSFGKFKVKVNTGYFDSEEVIFLLNSQGDVKFLKNDDYYAIESLPFFGETTLRMTSGGDEDFILGLFKLKNNKVIYGCAAIIDLPNEVLTTLAIDQVIFQRWDKASKKYLSILTKDINDDAVDCEYNLLSDYREFDIF